MRAYARWATSCVANSKRSASTPSGSRCPTWVQTLALDWGGSTLAGAELDAYLGLLRETLEAGAPLQGVLLYGIERPSHQPEAPELKPLPEGELRALAARIEALGLAVRVSV